MYRFLNAGFQQEGKKVDPAGETTPQPGTGFAQKAGYLSIQSDTILRPLSGIPVPFVFIVIFRTKTIAF